VTRSNQISMSNRFQQRHVVYVEESAYILSSHIHQKFWSDDTFIVFSLSRRKDDL
jgi:hypothetical protein